MTRSCFHLPLQLQLEQRRKRKWFNLEITKRHEHDKHWYKIFSGFVTYHKHHVQFMFSTYSKKKKTSVLLLQPSQPIIYLCYVIDNRLTFSFYCFLSYFLFSLGSAYSHDCYTNDWIFVIERHKRHQNNINSSFFFVCVIFSPNHHLILIIIALSVLPYMCVSACGLSLFLSRPPNHVYW